MCSSVTAFRIIPFEIFLFTVITSINLIIHSLRKLIHGGLIFGILGLVTVFFDSYIPVNKEATQPTAMKLNSGLFSAKSCDHLNLHSVPLASSSSISTSGKSSESSKPRKGDGKSPSLRRTRGEGKRIELHFRSRSGVDERPELRYRRQDPDRDWKLLESPNWTSSGSEEVLPSSSSSTSLFRGEWENLE